MLDAASVPIVVANIDEDTARKREFFSADIASLSRKNSRYQYNENPEKWLRLPDSLKEKSMTTRIGA